MILEDYTDALAYETAFWMAGVLDPQYPITQLGALSLEVSARLRTMAIAVLVSDGRTDSFYHNLIRSGRMRQIYLERCQKEDQLDDHHRASGRVAPLLDTIAAADYALAQQIVALSPSEFHAGHEYEDDYCYAQIIHRLVTDKSDGFKDLLRRFETYIQGAANPRLRIAGALVSREQQEFDVSVRDLIVDRDGEIQRAKLRGELEEPHVVAQRRIFVEGLAILRLAERRGLQTEKEYQYCPSIARVPMSRPFPGE
jgi:hypothetical protein